jgi:hypothetical protein
MAITGLKVSSGQPIEIRSTTLLSLGLGKETVMKLIRNAANRHGNSHNAIPQQAVNKKKRVKNPDQTRVELSYIRGRIDAHGIFLAKTHELAKTVNELIKLIDSDWSDIEKWIKQINREDVQKTTSHRKQFSLNKHR